MSVYEATMPFHLPFLLIHEPHIQPHKRIGMRPISLFLIQALKQWLKPTHRNSHVIPVLRVDPGAPLEQPLRHRRHVLRPGCHVQRRVTLAAVRSQVHVGRVVQEEEGGKLVGCNGKET